MELGMANRGEHSEIMTFMGQAVASEMSGNVIDLCPVGALTSKPFRFQARSWEMRQHDGVAMHDTVGSNTLIETLRNQVKRTLPRANDDINEDWLSDRDRFSYAAIDSEDRLLKPMLKINGQWKETDWQTALENVSTKLLAVVNEYGAGEIGALASPTATLEEFTLLKKLFTGMGSGNMDYRLRQGDFSGDGTMSAPLLGDSINGLADSDAALLIGSNMRKEQPMLAARLRKAARNGSSICAVNNIQYDFAMPMASNIAVSPAEMPAMIARLCVIAAEKQSATVDSTISGLAADCPANDELTAVAGYLVEADTPHVILGTTAQMSRQYSLLNSLSARLSKICGARFGRLEEGNAVAAWQAGFMPHEGGKNASEMLSTALKAAVLFNLEPSQDSILGQHAVNTLADTGMVVYIGNYRSEEIDSVADVMLPLAMHAESEGSHVNCEGKIQSWQAAVTPPGEARPGWKILRVLGNYLDQDGFDYVSAEAVRNEVEDLASAVVDAEVVSNSASEEGRIERVYTLPIYRTDCVTRRSDPLQQTQDNQHVLASMHSKTLAALGIEDDTLIEIGNGSNSINVQVKQDDAVATNCVAIPTAVPETTVLGNAGWLEVKGSA
jgi:NADH-quinone oxidoreductase subunit G